MAEHDDNEEPGCSTTSESIASARFTNVSSEGEDSGGRGERLQGVLAVPALNQRACSLGSRQLIVRFCAGREAWRLIHLERGRRNCV